MHHVFHHSGEFATEKITKLADRQFGEISHAFAMTSRDEAPLRKARIAVGLSMPQLARLAGTSAQQIDRLERGERKLTGEWAERLARHLSIAPDALVFAEARRIPVVGRIGGGGSIETEWENLAEPLFDVEMPFPLSDDAIGFEISGDSMMPVYQSGDVIVVSRNGEPVERLLDQEAAVRVPGVGRFFKRIAATSAPGLYDLESYNAKTMRGVQIEWAAGLIARVPASRWRRLNGVAVKATVRKARRAQRTKETGGHGD